MRKKGGTDLGKPIRYLWRNDAETQEEYEEEKAKYQRYGFRIVTYKGGTKKDIHSGLKEVIKNHLELD